MKTTIISMRHSTVLRKSNIILSPLTIMDDDVSELVRGIRVSLLLLKKRLYVFVLADFVLAILAGYYLNLTEINIRWTSVIAIFIMLYPMLTGLIIEKIKHAGKNVKLVSATLIFAFFVGSGTAYLISRTILNQYPDVAFAMVMVGAIPCSNMLIGWSGIAEASVEDALAIAVIGLLLIPVLSPILIKINGGVFVQFDLTRLVTILLTYILVPLVMGLLTRHAIIKKKGMKYFMNLRKYLPGVASIGVLLLVFAATAKVAKTVIANPPIFALIFTGLISYYLIQTSLSLITAKVLQLNYREGMVLIIGATASSQAISLNVAAAMFSPLTVFSLSFKPLIQVLYILFIIYYLGPRMKIFLNRPKGRTMSYGGPAGIRTPDLRRVRAAS